MFLKVTLTNIGMFSLSPNKRIPLLPEVTDLLTNYKPYQLSLITSIMCHSLQDL